MTYWHYTTADRLEGIIASKTINASKEFDHFPVIHNGLKVEVKRAVYLSKEQGFEMACVKPIADRSGTILTLSPREFHDRYSIVRVKVPQSLHVLPWPKLTKEQGVPKRDRVLMAKAAKDDGSNPKLWYGIIGDVKLTDVHAEAWVGGVLWERI